MGGISSDGSGVPGGAFPATFALRIVALATIPAAVSGALAVVVAVKIAAHQGAASASVHVEASPRVTPAPAASLSIRSRPAGAVASVDDRVLGATPVDAASVPPGDHRIAIALAGYAPYASVVHVEDREATVVDVGLVATPTAALVATPAADAGAVSARPRDCNTAFARCQSACAADEAECRPVCETCNVAMSDRECAQNRAECGRGCTRDAARCQARCEARFGGCVTD